MKLGMPKASVRKLNGTIEAEFRSKAAAKEFAAGVLAVSKGRAAVSIDVTSTCRDTRHVL